MSHRLFHTLVLSSAVLLEACGGSSGTSEPTSSGTATNEDTSGSEQAATDTSNATQVAALDAEMQAAVRDARACENGWPTTKGARFTSDATNTYACSSLGSQTLVCCVSGPAPTTAP